MDLTTLMTVASLFIGLVVGNAAMFGDSLFASIAVPKPVEAAGLNEATAEGIFVAHIARYLSVPSLLHTPSVQTASSPNLPTALATPLKLRSFVHAVQGIVRDDTISVAGSILCEGKGSGLRMYLVIDNPPDPPSALALEQPDGDAKTLIERAARRTLEIAAPFRVANADVAAALKGDQAGFARARTTALQGFVSASRSPYQRPDRTRPAAGILLGILARKDGDKTSADKYFAAGERITGAEAAAYGLLLLNRAFFAIVDKAPGEAKRLFDAAMPTVQGIDEPGVRSRIEVLAALVAWSRGRTAEAEHLLRKSITDGDRGDGPHRYLADLLSAMGKPSAAEEERKLAAFAHGQDFGFPSLAHTFLVVDPVNGGIIGTY